MPKKKSANTTKTATKKKATTKKVVEKKAKAKTTSKKKEEINPSDFLQKENENQLKSLITKEFDKELTEKSAAYIKSFVKIEDSLIPIHPIMILAHLQMTRRRKKNLQVLKVMILFACILRKWEMLSCFHAKVKSQLQKE
jgi:hypothetical protein